MKYRFYDYFKRKVLDDSVVTNLIASGDIKLDLDEKSRLSAYYVDTKSRNSAMLKKLRVLRVLELSDVAEELTELDIFRYKGKTYHLRFISNAWVGVVSYSNKEIEPIPISIMDTLLKNSHVLGNSLVDPELLEVTK